MSDPTANTIGNTNTDAHQTPTTSTTTPGTGAATNTGADATPPNHLGTSVPSGDLNGQDPVSEKVGQHDEHFEGEHDAPVTEKDAKPAGAAIDDDDDIEDIDALIDDLESQDGNLDDEEEEVTEQGGARPVSEEMLNTDTRIGLSEHEVGNRKKKYGLNQMKEEKENLVLKFLGYFVGPIQFVMEVSRPFSPSS